MTNNIREEKLRVKLELLKAKMGLKTRDQVIDHLITQSLLTNKQYIKPQKKLYKNEDTK